MEDEDFMEFGKRMLYFAPKDDINNLQPLGEIVEKSVSFDNDTQVKLPKDESGFSFELKEPPTMTIERSIVIVQGKDYIHRPKNLKYPNKKRKLRVLKKWKKRFGITYAKRILIPKATITIDIFGNIINITAIAPDNLPIPKN